MSYGPPEFYNPYVRGSEMEAVFNLIQDGEFHTLDEVVPLVTNLSTPSTPTTRRIASSFVRTLRKKFTMAHKRNLGYRLTAIKEY